MHHRTADATGRQLDNTVPLSRSWGFWWLRMGLLSLALGLAGLATLSGPVPDAVTAPVEPRPAYGEPVRHEAGGTVRAVLVREGQNVKAGDILVLLDGAEILAPRDGLVVTLHVASPGEVVAAGATVAEIAPRPVITIEA